MNLTKQQKKELRRIYEEKIGKEYVKGMKKQPPYTSSEWLDYMLWEEN